MKIETYSGSNHSKFLISFKIPFTEKLFLFKIQFANSPKAWVLGYSSRTQNGKYVLFFDYDNLDYVDVCAELNYLQKKFNLSDIYLFKIPDKDDSFHAVCLDTFTIKEAYDILIQSSCDSAFIKAIHFLNYREWVLRIGEKGNRKKPVYYGRFSNKGERIKSSAHSKFLQKWFKIKIDHKGEWDGLEKLSFVKYNTANRIEKITHKKEIEENDD